MPIKYDVPFYENTTDDTHCVQATYRMVLKYFFPDREFTWEELDIASAKQKDMWTWPMAGLCWLQDQGLEVVYIEYFDYPLFLERKEQYLIERYGVEIAAEQVKHSNIEAELKLVDKFLEQVNVQNRVPDLAEVFSYLDNGYLIIASVNYKSLHEQEGYVGHSVVITGYDDDDIFLNEPGRPGIANWIISHEQFSRGWSYPDKTSNNLTAIRLV